MFAVAFNDVDNQWITEAPIYHTRAAAQAEADYLNSRRFACRAVVIEY
jgi:hypothetical protein